MMKCSVCSASIKEGSMFCEKCGSPAEAASAAPVDASVAAEKAFCANCGSPQNAESKFCANCGSPVGEEIAVPHAASPPAKRKNTKRKN